jgi:predicted DNA-binding transcriptional regulator YafY
VGNQWCLFAFDVDRKAIRTFVLARLSKAALTGKRFRVSRKLDLNERLRGSLGVFHGEDDYEIVVELDAWAADDVRGRRLHSSQELTELPRGNAWAATAAVEGAAEKLKLGKQKAEIETADCRTTGLKGRNSEKLRR